MMFRIYFLLILTLVMYSCAPTYRIYLEKYNNSKYRNLKYDLKLKHLNDSSLVKLKHRGDFGLITSAYYELKQPVQNGHYQFLLNDTLTEDAVYRNGKRNGKTQIFQNDGKSVRTYKQGSSTGIAYSYDKYGSITEKILFINGRLTLRSLYNSRSEVKSHRFYVGQTEIRIERPDSNNISLIVDDKYHRQEKSIQIKPNKTKHIYSYFEGSFIVTYKRTEIINCKWIPANNVNTLIR